MKQEKKADSDAGRVAVYAAHSFLLTASHSLDQARCFFEQAGNRKLARRVISQEVALGRIIRTVEQGKGIARSRRMA